jgi:hypothetical protein
MQFTILVYETQSELAARTDPKRKDAYWGPTARTRRRCATPG